jgi:hypothetical protein
VLEDRGLDRPLHELLRMTAEELVEGIVARDVEREAAVLPPARAAPLLAQACHRSRKRHRDRRVEVTDVDSELEGTGRDDPQQLALGEAALDLAPLLWRVTGAVGREALAERIAVAARRAAVVQTHAGELVDELRGAAAAGEADRARAGGDEVGEQVGCLAEARAAGPRTLVEERRVAHQDVASAARCSVAVDQHEVETGEGLGQLQRVCDRRRGQHETGLGPVGVREPSQAAQHVGDVRAEDAPVDVRLVDDDQRQIREKVAPVRVVGEDADVKHVGVREDEVRASPDGRALLPGRVAVIDRIPERWRAQLRQPPRLVLSERLGGVQVERTRLAVDREDMQDREVEAERLAAGGTRGDDRVPLAHHAVPGLGLVREERGDADALEGLLHVGVKVGRYARQLRWPRRLARGGDEALFLSHEEPL